MLRVSGSTQVLADDGLSVTSAPIFDIERTPNDREHLWQMYYVLRLRFKELIIVVEPHHDNVF
jgi:hypothetical protein